MEISLLQDERIDDLQIENLRIIQKTKGFRFGMDAVLLAAFANVKQSDVVVDFGTGTGILPLLLYGRRKGSKFYAIEIQQHIANMAQRTMKLNDLQNIVQVLNCPVEKSNEFISANSVNVIVCNPPYGISGTTLLNPMEERSIARHQTKEGLFEWFKQAHLLLKGKGKIFVIYPAPRMLEMISLLSRAHLEPKRIRLIHPQADRKANLVLIQAMKDARPMINVEPPLIVYQSDGSMTEELKKIYENR